jgi:hypothetical protein
MLIFFGFDLYFDQRHLFFMANNDKDALTKVYVFLRFVFGLLFLTKTSVFFQGNMLTIFSTFFF